MYCKLYQKISINKNNYAIENYRARLSVNGKEI